MVCNASSLITHRQTKKHAQFREWLTELDGESYVQGFIDAGYDLKFILESGLTEEDLDCVGVPRSKLGLRRKLMQKWKIEGYVEEEGGEGERERERK